ncbi:DNA processing protein [Parabacteroides sp. PFB2-12]|uniref:DNA-processing protein DprA n=1 Tax=unclassified Parabacteroides TaxID=2649774 RepID=UPI002475BE3A|nr:MULTISPECIES: DNA-processing protein DprA [unclassified Parabacteroides]MDH6341695.1 DNA processing protein [Parabacteroides sp. PM6-13]MDH6389882.1 DNA processing protein [Parabacteroides sp. PFB2-12]
MEQNLIYQIGLTMINGIGDILARHLLETMGSAEAIFTEKKQLLEKVPGIGSRHIAEIRRAEVLHLAEQEASFVCKNNLKTYFMGEADYPVRLRECPDAPVLFYYKGNADLNVPRVISIVGTRKSTHYGRELTEKLIHDLAEIFPDMLIVSGLAYGIDIQAHRSALNNKLPTVAVLAHGLDMIYPSAHRNIAVEMLNNGGLLTDFPSATQPERQNFVKRNRIVAGLSDATVVIESAEKGGSLITADIAFSYGRDVFSFPGRVNDAHSKGCNSLIRQNKAGLITSAQELIAGLCWENPTESPGIPQQSMISFPENSDYDKIVSAIRGKNEIHINTLALATEMPVYKLSSLLFELEMEGVVKILPGGMYKLTQ